MNAIQALSQVSYAPVRFNCLAIIAWENAYCKYFSDIFVNYLDLGKKVDNFKALWYSMPNFKGGVAMAIYWEEGPLQIRSMKEGDGAEFTAGFAAQGWHKPLEQFERYYRWQEEGVRKVIVAQWEGRAVGYTTLLPVAQAGPFAGKYPEIQDFNVLIPYQRRGIGNRILDVAERLAGEYGDTVTLGVGLHSGYGPAQRIYIQRGYLFDGSGVWYRDRQLEPYAPCCNDDDLVLHLRKKLAL